MGQKFRRNRSISLGFQDKRVFVQKYKMAAKTGGKMIFFWEKVASRVCIYPVGQKFH